MKIRNGFISNSSSSSFIIVTPENYDYSEKVDDENLKELYAKRFVPEERNFDGKKVKIYEGWADTSCGENTLYNSESFNEYCNKKSINESESCEMAEILYLHFLELFDDNCLCIVSED